jgi:co-chaperonin GroES (HSP10)
MKTMKWLHPFVLVRKYVKPSKIGLIHLNPAWRTDNSRSLWELVETTPKATEFLGYELLKDWILISPPRAGAWLEDRRDEEGSYEVFLLWARSILKVIPWTLDGKDVPIQEGTVLVRREEKDEDWGGKILKPDTVKKPSNIGEVMETRIEGVEVGARIILASFSGVDMEIAGDRLKVVKEEEILGLIQEETP